MSKPPTDPNLPDFFRELENKARQLALRTIRLTGLPDRLLGLCLLDGRVKEGELAALLPKWAAPAGSHGRLPEVGPLSALTGLPGRTMLLGQLTSELALVERSRLPCGLLLLAIDPLSSIDAAHGRENGNQLIAQVVQRVTSLLHPHETIAHHGPGEDGEGRNLAILLPGASLRKASQRAEKIRQAIKETPAYVAGTSYQLTLSIGVGSCQADEPLTAEGFLAAVQRQLQRAGIKGDRVAQLAPARLENPCQVTVEERAQLFSCFAP